MTTQAFSAAIHFTALDSAGVITVLNLDVSQPDALLCADIEQCVNYLVEQQEAQEVRAELHCEQADPGQHRWLFYAGGNSARTNAGAKALTTMVFAAQERSQSSAAKPATGTLVFVSTDSDHKLLIRNPTVSAGPGLAADIESFVSYLFKHEDSQEVRAQLWCDLPTTGPRLWTFSLADSAERVREGAVALASTLQTASKVA